MVESYVRLSLAEIETRGSREIKRGSVRNLCNRTSVYSFSFRQVGPQILIVSIETEVCLLRPSISISGMSGNIGGRLRLEDSWRGWIRFYCSLYRCRGETSLLEIYKLVDSWCAPRGSEMAHGRIHGTIVCLHYGADQWRCWCDATWVCACFVCNKSYRDGCNVSLTGVSD